MSDNDFPKVNLKVIHWNLTMDIISGGHPFAYND